MSASARVSRPAETTSSSSTARCAHGYTLPSQPFPPHTPALMPQNAAAQSSTAAAPPGRRIRPPDEYLNSIPDPPWASGAFAQHAAEGPPPAAPAPPVPLAPPSASAGARRVEAEVAGASAFSNASERDKREMMAREGADTKAEKKRNDAELWNAHQEALSEIQRIHRAMIAEYLKQIKERERGSQVREGESLKYKELEEELRLKQLEIKEIRRRRRDLAFPLGPGMKRKKPNNLERMKMMVKMEDEKKAQEEKKMREHGEKKPSGLDGALPAAGAEAESASSLPTPSQDISSASREASATLSNASLM